VAESSRTAQIVIGVDPGASTGIAVYKEGVLWKLETISPHQITGYLSAGRPSRVIFEDSRLTSFMFTTVKSRPVALSMARKVGQVDGYCNLITAICADLGIPSHGISPKAKGAKLNAEQFAKATGWSGKSNQHERDSAIVAFPYRRAAK